MEVIIDSSSIFSLFVQTDSNHAFAKKISASLIRPNIKLYIPHDVLSETLNVLSKKINRNVAIATGEKLYSLENFILSEVNEMVSLSAFEKFRKQSSKVSYTDCLVMGFADFLETKYIFGFDEAFQKNGYIRIGIDN